MKRFLIAAVLAVALVGCTSNQRAKDWGGSTSRTLPAGQKLVMVTWKDNNMWILTRPMRPEEKPEIYTFREDSSWGVLQGTLTINEVK
jgi:hypothetical protein